MHLKKLLSGILILLYLSALSAEKCAFAFSEVSIPFASLSANSAILIEPTTGRVLFAKTPHRQQPCASTTKVMTALVILEKFSLDDVVRVPKSAEYVPKRVIGLRAGEKYYVRDLIRAMLITSANDGAHTLAVAAAGSEARFAVLMNAKAKKLGANETKFVNPHGLPHTKAQYSTVYDLALIMKAARRDPFIVTTMSQRNATIKSLTGRRLFLKSTNKMLWRAPNRVQGKTGFTRKARHCFVGKIRQPNKREYVVAVMGSMALWKDLTILLGLTNRLGGKEGGAANIKQVKFKEKQIARLQEALARAGYYRGPVDGVIGAQMNRAVKAFQRAHGLRADGKMGSKTLAKLKRYL